MEAELKEVVFIKTEAVEEDAVSLDAVSLDKVHTTIVTKAEEAKIIKIMNDNNNKTMEMRTIFKSGKVETNGRIRTSI